MTVTIILILVVCQMTGLAHAAITLPHQTTYNCAEQAQPWSGVLCDGVSANGGWTANGSGEQITTAANYSGGGGGRGQRHWVGNGVNSNSGSVAYSLSSSVNNIGFRWHARFQTGLKLSGSTGHKMWYATGTSCFGVECYVLIQPTQMRFTASGGGTTLNGSSGPCSYNALHPAAGNPGNDTFNRFEVYLKANTGTSSNGVVKIWVNGTLCINSNTVKFKDNPSNLGAFILPSNGTWNTTACSPGPQCYTDVDDTATRTGTNGVEIGALGGTPPTDNPPSVAMTTANNTTFTTSPALLEGTCTDDNPPCTSVQFTVDGANQGAADTSAPFNTSWTITSANNGSHQVCARGTDSAAQSLTSACINVIVSMTTGTPAAPSGLTITSPTAGSVSGNVEIIATVTPGEFAIEKATFFAKGVAIPGCIDFDSPYSCPNWNSRTVTHNVSANLTVEFCDTEGVCVTSAATSVTPTNPTQIGVLESQ